MLREDKDLEDFSVSQLKKFHHLHSTENEEKLDELIANNIGYSSIRQYDIEPDLSNMTQSQRLSTVIHDAIVDIYGNNERLSEPEVYDHIKSEIISKGGLDRDYSDASVYNTDLDSAVRDISENIAESFVAGSNVRTEELLENNCLRGRADIIREVDDIKELRDIKTKYGSEPRPYDEFGLACYALISRAEHDIDRFVLDYPVQGFEVEIEPEDWFSLVVDRAIAFEEILEDTREVQADQIRDFLDNSDKSDREKVENLGLNPDRTLELARNARSEI